MSNSAVSSLREMPSLKLLRGRINDHPVYAAVQRQSALGVFAARHVFAVWDFMSLLKRLQQELTCVIVPWTAPANPAAARLINEIVLGEESDETPTGFLSHYELYRRAMDEIGAPTVWIDDFLRRLQRGEPVSTALGNCGAPEAVVQFVETTFSIITEGSVHEIAAVFTLSREDLVPDMFVRVTTECAMFRGDYPHFFYYLDRHIEIDSGSHGPLAHRLLADLCGDNAERWQQAESAACRALTARLRLWDGVLAAIQDPTTELARPGQEAGRAPVLVSI